VERRAPVMQHRPRRRGRARSRPRTSTKRRKTKAQIRRELHATVAEAVRHLELFNRLHSTERRKDHLNHAVRALESALQTRPGNHILQRQLALCRAVSWNLDTRRTQNVSAEILLKPTLLGSARPRRL
jgi:hypothetical protein